MADTNTGERANFQLAVQTLATELGASSGDAIVLDDELMPVLGEGGGGGLPGNSIIGPDGAYVDILWQIISVADGTVFTLTDEDLQSYFNVSGRTLALGNDLSTLSINSSLILNQIPTSDPSVNNAVWSDGGSLKMSGTFSYAQVSLTNTIDPWDGFTIPFDGVFEDPGGLWDATNHQFVAPATGFYRADVWATATGGGITTPSAGTGALVQVNGAGANITCTTGGQLPPITGIVHLAQGDGIEVDGIGAGGSGYSVHGGTQFAITRVA